MTYSSLPSRRCVCVAVLAAAFYFPLSAQTTSAEDRARGMWNGDFRQQLGQNQGPGTKAAHPRSGLMLGLTAWRLRESLPGDKARLLVHEAAKGEPIGYTPERLGLDSQIAEGEKVRITVEVSTAGYLYVASRELYKDGSHGVPYLVFPSIRIRSGKAFVNPGELIEIPEWNNSTPYLTLRRSRPDQVGEQIFALISPRPLPGMMVERSPLKIGDDVMERWVKDWGGAVHVLDSRETRGGALTPAEKDAASSDSRLRPDDPLPQVLFRASNPAQDALLASYTLRLRQ